MRFLNSNITVLATDCVAQKKFWTQPCCIIFEISCEWGKAEQTVRDMEVPEIV